MRIVDLALLLILRDRYLLYECLNKNIRDQEFVVSEYVFRITFEHNHLDYVNIWDMGVSC